MSKERARRRAEREQQLAAATAAREAQAARQARADSRRERLTGWLPRPTTGTGGALAARHRQQTGLVLAFVVTANALTWLGTTDWPPRVLVLLLSILLTPIALSILSRK